MRSTYINVLGNTRIKTVHIRYDIHLYYMHIYCFFYMTHALFRVKTDRLLSYWAAIHYLIFFLFIHWGKASTVLSRHYSITALKEEYWTLVGVNLPLSPLPYKWFHSRGGMPVPCNGAWCRVNSTIPVTPQQTQFMLSTSEDKLTWVPKAG